MKKKKKSGFKTGTKLNNNTNESHALTVSFCNPMRIVALLFFFLNIKQLCAMAL